MDLHDLSEELPVNWESIMNVAQKAHDAFAELELKRANLKTLEPFDVKGLLPMSHATRDGRSWQPEFLLDIDPENVSAVAVAISLRREVMTLKGSMKMVNLSPRR